MTEDIREHTYFARGAISVTSTYLSTRFKDEALEPVQSVQIGRDPLWIAGVIGLGLLLFANRFGDLLLFHEQVYLTVIGAIVAAAGYCVATLQIGQHMRERTVLVGPIWTVNAVRKAIARAKLERLSSEVSSIILDD